MGDKRRLTALVVENLAAGWSVEQLRTELLRDLATASSRTAVWHSRLRDLGTPPAPAPAAPTLPPRCDDPEHDPYSADSNRMLYPEGGLARPCPVCHPTYLGAAS
ncbi:hypothetical protein IMZ11_41205 [Microtetraspora sp. AC03309]|nr:hypothetical protein [Microtetraspora sp. AC03309]